MRASRVLLVVGAVLVPAAAAASHRATADAADAHPAPATVGLEEAAREIQNVCFSVYPPDLVARMSGREGPVPAEVQSDPRLQIKYLKLEDVSTKGLFYPSLLEELMPGLEAEVKPGARFLDLGSGDGRVVFFAALLGAESTGIEYDKDLHALSLKARERLAHVVPLERAHLKRGDFFKENFAHYDVVFYYWQGSFLEKQLFDKMTRELRPDELALVSFMKHTPPGLEMIRQYGDVRVYRRTAEGGS